MTSTIQNILQSALVSLTDNNYVTLAIITAVGYDYILTFSQEVEYIWTVDLGVNTICSCAVRYVGLFNILGPTLVGSSFLYIAKTYVLVNSCWNSVIQAKLSMKGEIVGIVALWTFIIFVFAADLVMTLRVWAMYHQSRLILWITVSLFDVQIIVLVVDAAIGGRPQNISAATIQIQTFSFCTVQGGSPTWSKAAAILQISFDGLICMFAAVGFAMQSLQIYRATRKWQLNRYMNLFVREGIVYFVAFFLFNLFDLLSASGDIPASGWQLVPTVIVELVPLYTLTPRFILNMRELYARDTRSGGIDTGFGLSSLHGRNTAQSTMLFADAEWNEEQGKDEVPVDVRTTELA